MPASAELQWTDEQIETLREMWGNDYAIEIASIIGKSKSSVIGKAHRLGLENIRKPSSRAPRPLPAPPPQGPRVKVSKYTGRSIGEPEKPTFPKALKNAPPSLNLTLFEIGPGQCRYIEGDDRLYCGHETAPGSSWCPFHHRVVYRPIDERQRAKSRLQAAE